MEVAERSLRAGENKIDRLFSQVETRVIEQKDLERNGFTDEMFRNLNTEQEWQEAKLKCRPGDSEAFTIERIGQRPTGRRLKTDG